MNDLEATALAASPDLTATNTKAHCTGARASVLINASAIGVGVDPEEQIMHVALKHLIGAAVVAAAVFGPAIAVEPASPASDKYSLVVPGGLAFAEFKGYESWQLVNVSQTDKLAVILANPLMIEAFQAGAPANGRAFPDGAKMAKIHWKPEDSKLFAGPKVAGAQHDVDFMVKDSKRFADSGGWGYAVFRYDADSNSFRPGTTADKPPQANDAKCGFACHTVVQGRDYVFTEYATR